MPPLAVPAFCFDLRRGCSLAEHLVDQGRRLYLVDYGNVRFSDRGLGLEHWINEVLPRTIRAVSKDAGGAPVHVVAWCLGGILSLLTHADQPDLPIASIATVAAPIDMTAIPLVAPIKPLVDMTGRLDPDAGVPRAGWRPTGLGEAGLPAVGHRQGRDEAVRHSVPFGRSGLPRADRGR